VPDSFPSGAAYQQRWEGALVEEINLRMAEAAQGFHAACTRAGAAGTGCGSALEAAMQRARVPYHGQCELLVWRNYPGGKPGRKSRGGVADDGAGAGGEDAPAKPHNVYLIIKSGRVKSSEYRKGDVWVVSNHPLLQAGFSPGQAGDRTRAPWAAIARSLWHGPNQDGK
jgi:hypothetical protein